MKVVIAVPVLITGGAETMVARLATAIDRRNTEVEVVSMYSRQNSKLERTIEESGIRIHYLNKEITGNWQAAWNMFRLLSRIKPDVIHSHIYSTFYALPWIALHKAKLVHTIHTKPDVEFSKKLTKVLRYMVKLRKVILVAVSKENYALAKSYYRVSGKQIKYVNNPVDTGIYYQEKNRADGNVVFINVSRQDENKNQIAAIRAFPEVIKQVPNARLVLVGDGNQHKKLCLERDLLGLTDTVDLPGECDQPEHYLAKADVYISTSHREGLPLSMLEAMAAGLPVIATNVGGVPDVVRDNGVLIADNDRQALVTQMCRFGKDKDLREQCGAHSKEIVKEFDSKKCAEAYIDIYREAIT